MFSDRRSSNPAQEKASVSKQARSVLTIDPRVPEFGKIHLANTKRDLLGRRPTLQIHYHEPVLVLAELGCNPAAIRPSFEVALPGQILFPVYKDRQLVGYLDLKKLGRNHFEEITPKWFTQTRDVPWIYVATQPDLQVVDLRSALTAASNFISLTGSICPTNYSAHPVGVFFENLPFENSQSPNALLLSAYLLASRSKFLATSCPRLTLNHSENEHHGTVYPDIRGLRQRLLELNRAEGLVDCPARDIFTGLCHSTDPIELRALFNLDGLQDGQQITPYRLFPGLVGSIDPTMANPASPTLTYAHQFSMNSAPRTGFFLRINKQDGLWFATVTADGLEDTNKDLLIPPEGVTRGVRARRLVFNFPEADLAQDSLAVSAKTLLARIVNSSDTVEVTSPMLHGSAIRLRYFDINCEVGLRLVSQDRSTMILMSLDGLLQARSSNIQSKAVKVCLEVDIFPIIPQPEEAWRINRPKNNGPSAVIPALFLPEDINQLNQLSQIIATALTEEAHEMTRATTPIPYDASVQT